MTSPDLLAETQSSFTEMFLTRLSSNIAQTVLLCRTSWRPVLKIENHKMTFPELLGPNVFWVTDLKILGKVGTHIFCNYFFFLKKYYLMHFDRHFAFQNAFFSRKPEKNSRFHQ